MTTADRPRRREPLRATRIPTTGEIDLRDASSSVAEVVADGHLVGVAVPTVTAPVQAQASDGWWVASDGNWYPPELAPAPSWTPPPSAAPWPAPTSAPVWPVPAPAPVATAAVAPSKPWFKRKRVFIPAAILGICIVAGVAAGPSEEDSTVAADAPTTLEAPARQAAATPAPTSAPQTTIAAVTVPPAPVTTPAPAVTPTAPPTTTPRVTAPPTTKATGPSESVSQRNARNKAQAYLDMMPFSRKGLIEQLQFEGFSVSDSTYGVDAQHANWNDQAARKAAAYLDMMPFSRASLIEQLVFDGFTQAQAQYGVSKTGL